MENASNVVLTVSLTPFTFWMAVLNLGLAISWWNWRQVAKGFGVTNWRAIAYGVGLSLAVNGAVFAIANAVASAATKTPLTLG